jgi:hypothetical protein
MAAADAVAASTTAPTIHFRQATNFLPRLANSGLLLA